jgi:CBS domain containing-hemolysin-like protein
VLLVAGTAAFVAIEFALVAVDRGRLAEERPGGDRRAARLSRLLDQLPLHLSGAQLGVTATSVTLGFLVEPAVADAVEPVLGRAPSVATAFVLAVVVQLVLGELVPRAVAVARPDRTAAALAPLAHAYGWLLGPLIRLLHAAADRLARAVGVQPAGELTAVGSLEELELLIRSWGEEGTLAPEAYSVLRRALRFHEKTAADALVPRVDVAWLPKDATVADVAALAAETGHSRFPVAGDDFDDVVGVVDAKDVYAVPYAERASVPATSIAAPAWVVPETADLADLLVELRRVDTQLAVVVDEYGGTAGLLTLTDVLEELVGDVGDDDATHQRLSRVLPAGTYLLPGTLHADEVADACGLRLPDGPYETLAGFVLHRMGRIPEPGDAIVYERWCLEVAEMDRLRIATVRLTAPEEQEDALR